MNISPVLKVYEFPQPVEKRLTQVVAFAPAGHSYADVSQQLRNMLQSSIELDEVVGMFHSISQKLIQYDGLEFINEQQNLHVAKGQCQGAFRLEYRLEYGAEFIGSLNLYHHTELQEHELISFESLTTHLVFPLRNGLKYHAAMHSAMHDALTGAGNRMNMLQALEHDMQVARRMQQPLAILMVDIDFFKRINDTYGHACGDLALVRMAQLLKSKLRGMDGVFRFGGEEFLVSLPGADSEQVMVVAERLRQSIEAMTIDYAGEAVRFTASLGAAVFNGNDTSLEDYIRRADDALYEAKNAGRNQVVLAP